VTADDVDLDKIRRGAELAMQASVEDQPQLAWMYAGWIKRHIEELLYEDLWRAMEPR
jgi:hypothetical protein